MSDYIVFLILALNTIFGVGILQRNPKELANRLYAVFVASGNVWIFANYLENEPRFVGINGLEFFLRLDFFFAIIAFYFWFRFISVFVNSVFERAVFKYVRPFVLFIVLLVASTSFYDGVLISHVRFVHNVIEFQNGAFFNFYAITHFALLLSGIAALLIARKAAKKEKNMNFIQHIDLILLGSALSLSIAFVVNFIQVYQPISLELSRIGLYGMSLMIVFTAYSLVSARLFEMRLVILRSIAFLMFAVFVANLAIFAVVLFTTSILHVEIDKRTLVVSIFAATLISLGFDYMRGAFERATDRIFFRGRYHPDNVLRQITQTMIEAMGIEEMGMKLLGILGKEFRIEKTAIFFPEIKTADAWLSRGFNKKMHAELQGVLHNGLLSTHLITDEIPEGKIRELLKLHDISSVFMIKTKEKPIALLLLGPKLSGEPLHEEDVTFLELLASEMAIGIQNARAFSTITQFNKELEIRVEERTRALEKSQKQELVKAQEVLRLKDEFVFLAAHELRAPITAIRGFIELSEDYLEQVPPDIKENLGAIKETSDHLNQLINDLLEIARNENASMTIEVKEHAFEPILNRVLKTVEPLIGEKNITLVTHIDPIPTVLCDETKLHEVLLNLASNAIKYNRDGGTITVSAYHPQGAMHMVFEIQDTGYGIAKEQQERIFQKFFRAGTKGTQGIIGTGLGLFLTRMLVEKMRGKISFSSAEQQGTTFTFTLPISSK